MQIFGSIFSAILIFFTAIGDGTVFVFGILGKILLRILIIFVAMLILLAEIIMQILSFFSYFFASLFHRRKRKKIRRKTFSPIGFKLRYFFLGVTFSFLFLFLPLCAIVIAKTLPSPGDLGLQQFPQTTKIYDRHHTLLYQIYATQNRTLVHLSDVPLTLQEATIAIEDKNFYQNPGFDLVAIIRAFFKDIKGRKIQGGSTITQQLIKSSLLTSDQTIGRKIEEIILSFWAEKLYSKKQILEMYFNQVPYGGTAWGVESAAQTYFGKDVKDLDLSESAFLAGMPQAPSLYSPFGSTPEKWKIRQEEVLDRMKELGYISADDLTKAKQEEIHFTPPHTPLLAPHFVMYIRDLLIQRYGLAMVEKGGLSVTTTLDLPTQSAAEQVVQKEVAADEYLNLSNGAALVTNPTNGDILAMVGSRNYFDDQIDGNVNLTTALRQPGSSIKIVTYAAAMTKGLTAASILDDSPVTYSNAWETYSPVNYDGRFHGRVSMRIALANSFNIPAVKTLNSIGIPAFVTMGRSMGISSLKNADAYGLSVTLGAADVTMLDMATAYGTLANMGKRVDLNPLLQVTDYKGNVLEQKQVNPVEVLDPGIAFILSNILSDNAARSMEFGTNSPLYIPNYTVSVKTGTTDNKRDNWTFGYTKNRLVAVWVGNNDNSPMSQNLASGITGAAPIWHNIMQNLLQGKRDDPFTPPADVIQKQCIGRNEYFVKGTENNVNCTYIPPTPSPSPTH